MKHIENFNKFNESWISDIYSNIKKLSKDIDERHIYDKISKIVFQRIKDTFEYDRLSKQGADTYIYELEETDSSIGYIKVCVVDLTDLFVYNYDLHFDDNPVKCSTSIKHKIFKFLKEKWKLREEKEKENNFLNFKNKYNI